MRFREGTMADGLAILADLRRQQCRSLEKLELNAEKLLKKALDGGSATTVLIDDRPAAMFGVIQETMLGLPKIWLITTPLIEREPISFLRWSRRFTKALYAAHGTLVGVVDSEFGTSRAWLRWCGFVEHRQGDFIVMRYSGGH
jgi:hypothetical protein